MFRHPPIFFYYLLPTFPVSLSLIFIVTYPSFLFRDKNNFITSLLLFLSVFHSSSLTLGSQTFSCIFRTRFSYSSFTFSYSNKTLEVLQYVHPSIYTQPLKLFFKILYTSTSRMCSEVYEVCIMFTYIFFAVVFPRRPLLNITKIYSLLSVFHS